MRSNKTKKVFAWILSAMLITSLLPGLVFAEDGNGEAAAAIPFTASAGDSELTKVNPKDGGYTPYAFDAATNQMKPASPVMLYVIDVPEDSTEVNLTFPEDVLAYNYTADGATYLAGEYENDGKTGVKDVTVQIDFDKNGEMDCIQVQTPYDDNWSSTTLYAITFEKGEASDNETYTIEIDLDDTGSIEANTPEAKAGETITITVEPDQGLRLDKLEVTTEAGEDVAFKKEENGTFTFVMPAANVKVLGHLVEDENQHDAVCPSKHFEDLDTSLWYHKGIDYVLNEKIMKGVSEKRFDPDTPTSRAMIVTMLWRMTGSEVTDYSIGFEDVEANSWYADAVKWAAKNEIVTGYDEKTFGSNDPITREQLAAILFRYAEKQGIRGDAFASDLTKYEDLPSVSGWALDGITWCVATGIINGVTETQLQPKGTATRAQAATILSRLAEKGI